MLSAATRRCFTTSARRQYALAQPVKDALQATKQWKGTSVTGGETTNLIGGEWTVGEHS